MGICDFLSVYGSFPQNCGAQSAWMESLLTEFAGSDHYRCGSGATDNPSDAVLDALFAPCPVPDPAIVSWIDTTNAPNPEASIWLNCGTATDWDSDGDTFVDREWLPLRSRMNYDQHTWNDPGSKSSSTWGALPGSPSVTITTSGRPVLLQYAVTVTIELNGVELAGGTGAQLRVTQNGTPLPTGLSDYTSMHSFPVGNWGAHFHDQQAGAHSWSHFIELAAGTYTFALQWRVSGYVGGRMITTGLSGYNNLSVREIL